MRALSVTECVKDVELDPSGRKQGGVNRSTPILPRRSLEPCDSEAADNIPGKSLYQQSKRLRAEARAQIDASQQAARLARTVDLGTRNESDR